ncbi:2-dehydro-3-deoxygalactonokinase [Falsirhodobacter sp. 20TX0035]|uniref:2-dehydro-3-deoxygalactonokinase n=1 Tax=Falsirhodobacter sp. 20TX0035 TaxID=3022019 RepID=UPI00232D57E7|nr:2-dehydro-3-deoxygalactonokinase [Falsirhodobacter sp. 20TX0035]MDB6454973.1 2-dehydro-3-deoxygalactonokinase [Falsirhodobacter sp. 20TX0035]
MDWIAVDRGARLRLWKMNGTTVLGRADAPRPETREALLAALPERSGPVVVAGAADLWDLWSPLPAAVPAPVLRDGLHLLPGLRQDRPLPDAVNGAMAPIAGLLAVHPQFDGTLVVAGERTVWASLSAGEVTDTRSTLTGRLFDALATGGTVDERAFAAALPATLSRPETLAAQLAVPGRDDAHLAAALIGAELAATKAWWLGRSVLVTGEGALPDLLVRALSAQGVSARAVPEEELWLAGLRPRPISA